jgi:hypothetical protein
MADACSRPWDHQDAHVRENHELDCATRVCNGAQMHRKGTELMLFRCNKVQG